MRGEGGRDVFFITGGVGHSLAGRVQSRREKLLNVSTVSLGFFPSCSVPFDRIKLDFVPDQLDSHVNTCSPLLLRRLFFFFSDLRSFTSPIGHTTSM